MRSGARPRGRGFWKGMITGIVLALVAIVVLMMAFPPIRYLAPRVGPGAAVAPAPPPVPAPGPARPDTPDATGLLPAAPEAPLIAARPAAEGPPDAPALGPTAAPDIFDGGPAGSPSLFRPRPAAETPSPPGTP